MGGRQPNVFNCVKGNDAHQAGLRFWTEGHSLTGRMTSAGCVWTMGGSQGRQCRSVSLDLLTENSFGWGVWCFSNCRCKMVGKCEGKEWFTWVQACQCCALAVKTMRLSCAWWPIKTILLLCWKTFFSCWLTKDLAACLPSCSTSRYSPLILSTIFPSCAAEVELWEKCYREVKDNKMNSVQSQTQEGNAPSNFTVFPNELQPVCLWKTTYTDQI